VAPKGGGSGKIAVGADSRLPRGKEYQAEGKGDNQTSGGGWVEYEGTIDRLKGRGYIYLARGPGGRDFHMGSSGGREGPYGNKKGKKM